MQGPERIRVMISGGTPALRAGLGALISAREGFDVLEPDADESCADVFLAADIEAARDSSVAPVVAVVETADEAAEILRREGVAAAIPGDADGSQVAAAVTAASAGLLTVSPSFGLLLGEATDGRDRQSGDGGAAGGETLSPRELDVLTLIADGLPNKAIALRLGISDNTVKFHAGSILGKLGAASRAEAVMLAARKGLLTV